MALACTFKQRFGRQFCASDCPASAPCGIFEYVRVERADDVPPPDPRAVDVAILDMNHGWPNLGHDSLVHAVMDAGCELIEELEEAGLRIRAVSYEVRRASLLPEPPGGRFALYLGTGGPGHIDPRRNDGQAPWTQGIHEDPAWEEPAFRLFDAIRADEEAALLGVCHTFGVLCRWSGAARPVLRGPEKGKSVGVLENVLTREAHEHPWFRSLDEALRVPGRIKVVENRLFDLIPPEDGVTPWALPIGFETLGVKGPRGDAVTMLEFARDRGGVVPRIFAANHHPEIVDRQQQLMILFRKRERGEVSEAWYQERLEALSCHDPGEDAALHLTSDYTLLGPLRFHLFRQLRLRAESLGQPTRIHEERVLRALLGEPVGSVLAGRSLESL